MSLERRSFCKARQEIHLPYPWRVYFLIISGHFRTSSHDFSPHWHEMAELNNHAVLHEEEDTEDGECVDRCCYVILNLKSVFESFAFAMQLSGHGKQNQQTRSLFSLAESFICNPFIHLPWLSTYATVSIECESSLLHGSRMAPVPLNSRTLDIELPLLKLSFTLTLKVRKFSFCCFIRVFWISYKFFALK